MELVVILLDFHDETWTLSPSMPRYLAERVCFDFALGFPWVDGRYVRQALLIPRDPIVH